MSDAFIVLDTAAAAAVREREAARIDTGATSLMKLEPRALEDGESFILPAGVLHVEQHAVHHEHLAALPVATLGEIAHLLSLEETP